MRNSSFGRILAIFAAAASALALAAFAAPGFPQAAPNQQTQSQTPQMPAVHVSTRLVQVNVIAQDGDGKPVMGLTKEDFEILDQGRPQHISFFSLQENTTVSTERAAAAAPVVPPGMHLFSNRLQERTGVPPNVTVILLDALNTRGNDLPYARKQLEKFVQTQLRPEDRVALYEMTGSSLSILHDFTTDATELLAALDKNEKSNTEDFRAGASEPEAPDTGDAILDASVGAFNARMALFYMNDRVEKTATALKVIADHISGLPGRKNLVWVSASFPMQIIGGELPLDTTNYASQIEDAARALNNANVAIYPVDARGLIANPTTVTRPGVRAGRGVAQIPNGSTAPSPFPSRQNFDSMIALANRTGGRAFYNTNDIKGSVRHAIDESRVTYMLGYYPEGGEWDKKFHEIKVKVNKGGVHLRYREGYFAIPETIPTPQEKLQMMAAAVWSPLEATELGLDLEVEPIDVPGARQVKTKIHVSPGQMRFAREGDKWTDLLDVVWVIVGRNGNVLAKKSAPLNMGLTQQNYDTVMRDGLSFSGTIDLTDDATEVRVVARDSGTGAIGSVVVPLGRLFRAAGR
ncbi:MAG: VWA domain-containing protein [Candidatus Acidiferrales bacterium]